MPITIERDRNSHGDLFKVKAQEPGFGRGWQIKRLTLTQAQIITAHYFGLEHDKGECRACNGPRAATAMGSREVKP